MKKLYCVICGKYRKLVRKLVFSIICGKCKSENEKLFKQKESFKIWKILGLIENISLL